MDLVLELCVKNANVSIKGIEMGQAVDGLVQDVKWGSWPDTAATDLQGKMAFRSVK